MRSIPFWASTVFLTLLIWVSADQLVTENATVSMVVHLRAEPGSRYVVKTAGNESGRVSVTFRGRQSEIVRLKDRLSKAITVAVPDPVLSARGLGDQKLPLMPLLAEKSQNFGGCSVVQTDPPSLSVHVDRRIERTVPVMPQVGHLEFNVEPRVTPASVQATVLETEWAGIESANPRIELDVQRDLAHQPPGEPIEINVPLPLTVTSDRGSITIFALDHKTAKVHATLRRRLKRVTLQAVPIKFQASPSVWNRYTIRFRQENPSETLRIDVVGRPDIVDQLEKGTIRTFGVISIGATDTLSEDTFQFYRPEFNLPKGVELAPDQEIEDFEIRLERRPEPFDSGRPPNN